MFFSEWIHSNQLKLSRLRSFSSSYLMPGFKGESLQDRELYKIRKTLRFIQLDIKQQLQRESSLNKSLRKSIFDNSGLSTSLSYDEFWKELSNKHESQQKKVAQFIEKYSLMMSLVFVLKQKLLINHANLIGFQLYPAYFSNLNTLYTKLFASQIATDIHFLSFQTGTFTWYDPSAHLLYNCQDLHKQLLSVKPAEFLRLIEQNYSCAYEEGPIEFITKMTADNIVLNINASLSNKEFLELIKRGSQSFYSHSEDGVQHEFLNIISELYFCLTKQTSSVQNHGGFIQKIAPIMTSRSAIPTQLDKHFLIQGPLPSSFLKKVSQIKSRVYITQYSASQVFQPSHKDKNQKILTKLKLVDHTSIKGLLNTHIYRYQDDINESSNSSSSHAFFKIYNTEQKASSLNLYDDLQSLKTTIQQKKSMVFSHRFKHCNIDYFQDVIVDGILLSSTKNSQELTHPRFFQALTTQCVPLESLFKTAPLNEREQKRITEDLPLIENTNTLPPFVLVIKKQYESRYQCEVDIIPGDSYLGYLKDHGSFENQFFALIPKVPQLSTSLLRTFFQTQIGKQICQLCFRGNSHYRTKIKTLLIPKLIGSLPSIKSIDESNLNKALNFNYKEDSPVTLGNIFTKIQNSINDSFQQYPLSTLQNICLLKSKTKSFIMSQDNKHIYHIDFYHSQLITELKSLNTIPILPRHDDIFIDLKINKQELHLHFNKMSCYEADDLHENFRIELFNENKLLVTIYTKKYLYEFMKFLLAQMYNIELSQVLKSLNLPRERELAIITAPYETDNSIFHEIIEKCDTIIERLFQSYIMYKDLDD